MSKQSTEFRPSAHYDPDGDCIELFVNRENFYAMRIDSSVTIYYSQETGEVVGAFIKGITAMVGRARADAAEEADQ